MADRIQHPQRADRQHILRSRGIANAYNPQIEFKRAKVQPVTG